LVSDFAEGLEQNWHCIYCDSYFSGLATAEALDKAKQLYTMCCQANRPGHLWTKRLHRNLKEKDDLQWTSHPTKEILAVSWMDNNKVNILTNTVPKPTRVLKARVKNLGRTSVFRIKSIPDVVQDYRMGMGSVDHTNAKSNRYRFPHRLCKWTRAAFFGVLQMMVTEDVDRRTGYPHEDTKTIPETVARAR